MRPLAPVIGDRAPALRSQAWRFALERADRAIAGKPRCMQNVFSAYRVAGPLDLTAWREALDQLAVRHAALRTELAARGDRLEQVVRLDAEPRLEVVDLRPRSDAERGARSRQAIEDAIRHPFELTRAPLVRWQIQQRAAADHAILMTGHHIVLDGWSIGVAMRDLFELYEDIVDGRDRPARRPPRQLPDVARAEHAWLSSDASQPERAYWRDQFLRPAQLVELPGDRTPRAAPSWRAIMPTRRIAAERAAPIRALTGATDATLYIVLLAGFVELLHRWTGARDVTLCTTHAGRSHLEVEDTVGDLTRTLLLRIAWSGAPSFRELVANARAVVLRADAHSALPCSEVLAMAGGAADLLDFPGFLVQYGRSPVACTPRDVRLTPEPVDWDLIGMKSCLVAQVADRAIELQFPCREDCYRAETIDRALAELEAILLDGARDPDRRIGR